MSIWFYPNLESQVEEKYRLTLGEGNTPLEIVEFEDSKLLLKREDQNPNKSFKDRSIAFQISHYIQKGQYDFVISSSGNAAMSALNYAKLNPKVSVSVYVSDKIPDYKFKPLKDICNSNPEKFRIIKTKRPKSQSIKDSGETDSINLRASTDNLAIDGYKTIAYELYKQESRIDALFVCVSSATAALGIYKGYLDLKNQYPDIQIPAFNIVQSSRICPIASEFDDNPKREDVSLDSVIVDKVANRKNEIVELVRNTNGSGWIVDNDFLEKTTEKFKNLFTHNPKNYNMYLSVSGYMKSQNKYKSYSYPVCIISGI